MHLDEERIQRALHGELSPSDRFEAERHLAGCADCRGRVEAARRDEDALFALLRRADHAAPRTSPAAIAEAAGGGLPAWGRLVAGILIALVAAGAAYTAPGSPLPGLVHRVGLLLRGAPATDQTPAPEPAPAPPVTRGISVAPSGRFVIRFEESQPAGAAFVTLTDAEEIAVRVVGGTAAFASADDLLTVQNAGSAASYEIEIPRAAPWVEIRIGARVLLSKRGDAIASEATADSAGRRTLPLAAAPGG